MDTQLWTNMFYLAVPVLEKIIRPVLVYAFLVVGLRLAGKRELAQLNPFDLVVLLTLSNTVQNAIIGNDTSVTGGLIGAATLLLINYLVVRFIYGHQDIERLVEGEPVVLIDKGQVQQDSLAQEVISLAALEEAAHKQGFASLDEIERATLEPGGAMAFIAKKQDPAGMSAQEMAAKLDHIARELAGLRAAFDNNMPE
jgi:uncharacterized membrane protein YcaP (DUF421 family)